METEGSLPHSQKPTACPYSEPDRSSPRPHPTSLKSILILSSNLRMGLPSFLLLSGFPTKILHAPLLSPIHALYPANLSLLDLTLRSYLFLFIFAYVLFHYAVMSSQ
jgi:hypothetical protein